VAEYENFLACVFDLADKRGFGPKRAQEIADRYTGLSEQYTAAGHATPEELAMRQVFSELHEQQAAKAKLAQASLNIAAEQNERVSGRATVEGASFGVRGLFGDSKEGLAEARAAISFVQHDDRFKGSSYHTDLAIDRGALWSVMNDVMAKIEKGAFGVQRGAAHLENMVRHLFGENTGDAAAKDLATAWRKTTDASVDMFNAAGGAMRKLADWNMPQAQSYGKILKQGGQDGAEWIADHIRWLDWSKMAWPDGSPIGEGSRIDVLKDVYKTLSTDGLSKIDPSAFRGQGSAVGNAMNEHRFLRYKDGASWLEMHGKYGEGTVFDVMAGHIDSMAHQTALIRNFGPNPQASADRLKAAATVAALNNGGTEAAKTTEAVLKSTFDPMFATIMRRNAVDPHSIVAASVTATSNLLTAAQLGSASLLAIPGDFMTAAAVQIFNKTGLSPFNGLGTYLKTLAFDAAHQKEIALQSGFVLDGAISSTYAHQRFNGVATYGPEVSKRISDTMMRLSLMNGHTEAARWSVQQEMMGLFNRYAKTPIEELPFGAMLDRYGVTAKEWDAFRNGVQAHSPAEGVNLLRPIDLLQSSVDGKEGLFRQFQSMVLEESRKAVPEATIEGAVTLKSTTRPDTLVGALLHSFAMYKNFPVSMMMIYGRAAMANPDRLGRLGMIGGLGAGMTVMGALGVQMKELSKGRDPLPMNTPAFWGQSMLSGGAMGIWGDFLFSNVNRMGNSPAETAAGPLIGFGNDVRKLAFGDTFKWVDSFGHQEGSAWDAKFPARAVEFAKRYTPGSNLWYARLALERNVFDRMQELADPRAYSSWNQKMQKQRRENGNEYYWTPGTPLPDRAPTAQGIFGR
jgi:hypothetical protein